MYRKEIINTLRADTPQAKKIARKRKNARYMREVYSKNRKRVRCTLFLDEYDKLSQIAKQAGYTPTTFLKMCAMSVINRENILSKSMEEKFGSLLRLTGNIANNINQIAKHANTIKKASIFDLAKARTQIYRLEECIERFIYGS